MAANLTLYLSLFIFFFTPTIASHQINVGDEVKLMIVRSYSPFSTALQTLQNQINYTFHHIDLLRRAMTHPSFSQENNRALSVLGASIIETTVSLRYLLNDIDVSSKDLNNKIAEASNVESCARVGMQLGLHKVVRVSHKTNSTTPGVVCGAFRAVFGAVAVDTGKSDDAGAVYWNVHGPNGVTGVAM